jgi:hypothetical protein
MRLPIINGTYDQAARESFKVNPASAFSWFLSASFAYYLRFESLLSDEVFDQMCKYLLDNYDKLDHINKSLVTKDMLKAGSAYNLSENDYPLRVRISSEELIRNLLEHKNMTGENQK